MALISFPGVFCNDLEGTRAGCHNHVTVSGIQIFGMVLDVVVDEGEDEIVAVIITLIEQKKNKIELKSVDFVLKYILHYKALNSDI